MATALPDIEGDKRGQKNTLAVKLGHRGTQVWMSLLLLTAALLQALTLSMAPGKTQSEWIFIPVGFALVAAFIPKVHTHIVRMGAVALTTITGALAIEIIYILAVY